MKRIMAICFLLTLPLRSFSADSLTELREQSALAILKISEEVKKKLGVSEVKIEIKEIYTQDAHHKFAMVSIEVPGKPGIVIPVICEIRGIVLNPSIFIRNLNTKVTAPLSVVSQSKFNFHLYNNHFIGILDRSQAIVQEINAALGEGHETKVREKVERLGASLVLSEAELKGHIKELKDKQEVLLARKSLGIITDLELTILDFIEKSLKDINKIIIKIETIKADIRIVLSEVSNRSTGRAVKNLEAALDGLKNATSFHEVADKLGPKINDAVKVFGPEIARLEAQKALLEAKGGELRVYEIAELEAVKRSLATMREMHTRVLAAQETLVTAQRGRK